MKKFHIIYKTTNLITEQFYIGKHSTNILDDGYLGSGIWLRRAIKKYGEQNFCREILFIFDNQYEMNSKEKELITEELVNDSKSYNIACGGQGGNLGILVNKKISENTSKALSGKPKSEKHKQALSKANSFYVPTFETKKKIKDTLKKTWSNMSPAERQQKQARVGEQNGFYGKTHTEDTKNKIKSKIGDSRKGFKNPRAKSIIFNGVFYATRKECMESLGLNKKQFYKLLGETQC